MMRRDDPRVVLAHRLHRLLPRVPFWALRRLWRALIWGFWTVYFVFIALALALRYSILPNIETYRPDIERLVSQGLGQTVSIGRIEASWEGINPDLSLLDVRIADAAGRPALAFSRVEAILSWWSVPSAQLKLRLLRIDQPTLNLRRDTQGRVFIAGIPLSEEQSDADVSDWVLAQRRIRIQGATLVWEDELRGAPTLTLKELNFALDNDGRRHRFGMTALPPEGLASKIDVRGDFRGKELEKLGLWSGKGYAQIDYADLAVWRKWVDYPVALPHGRGAVRTWFEFSEGRLRELTADMSLSDVSLRLAPHLPSLELDHMSGRVSAGFTSSGFRVDGRQIELVTLPAAPVRKANGAEARRPREGIRIAPTDFHVEWLPESDGKTVSGSVSANRIDLGLLSRLAEYLPFDQNTRKLLADYAPRGQISGLNAKWRGDDERLEDYALKASFEGLALKAQGYFPGFSGLSGSLEADEKGGSTTLRTQQSTIDLPGVFPESLISLDKLNAQAKWKVRRGVLDVELPRVEFAGADGAGFAQGTYRNSGSGPGSIDLTATLNRGDARAVWRYMPHVVSPNARYWLRDSLLAGGASEAKLTLRGNLEDFPFLDKSKGEFLVTVKAQDVTLDYAKGWPRIDGISGDLRFEGNGMVVDAREGSIFGVRLKNTRATIPDLDAEVSTLTVKGQAEGAMADFLRFIDQSPVADRIDHFTADMRANGNGQLDLALQIPLDERKLGDSKIDGNFRFMNNEITVDTALPPIRQVNGSLQFSGKDLRIPEINGQLFGGPLRVKGGVQKDGRVLISANGMANIDALRKQSDLPGVAMLSGSAAYRGEVLINKRNADLIVNSNLVGLASTLPEPFRKAAAEPLALRFEKKVLPGQSVRAGAKTEIVSRDQIALSLGNLAALQAVRRKQGDAFAVERAVIAVGQPPSLPESGVHLAIGGKVIDLDIWRRALAGAAGTEAPALKPGEPSAGPSAGGAGLMPTTISLRTPEMVLFGRAYHEVDVAVTRQAAQWRARMASRQASGDLVWDSAGSGKVTARLKHLALEPASSSSSAAAGEDATRELPALDIVADDFSIGPRRFGRLEVQARNEGGAWRLSRIQASNPFGTFSGSGAWRTSGGRNRTDLVFSVDSSDVGGLLDRFGFPGAVRAGTAHLEGRLGWKGAPTAFDYESLNGEIKVEAASGQFLQVDPGVGKLISLISLQNLPRRVILDFKDVFSEGFAFDSISSVVSIQDGQMHTDRLQIDGTSARVVMRGDVDLKRETQRLNVNVQPELGSTAALGIAIVHPLAGVATLLAHKVLQSPLNQMFGFNYRVTGSWSDPVVEKVSGGSSAVPAPRLPPINSEPGGSNESSAR